jgi:hypothetical protein
VVLRWSTQEQASPTLVMRRITLITRLVTPILRLVTLVVGIITPGRRHPRAK